VYFPKGNPHLAERQELSLSTGRFHCGNYGTIEKIVSFQLIDLHLPNLSFDQLEIVI